MATLIADVQARYPTQTLVDLTRRGDTSGTTLDTGGSSILQTACDDIESADFRLYVQMAYDSTNRMHVAVACEGVLAKLKVWAREGSDGGKAEWERWVARAQALARVTSRDRISPLTTSDLTIPEEVEAGQEVHPHFNTDEARDYRPGP